MTVAERVQRDMTEAMKARDEARLGALRMIKAAFQHHAMDSRTPLDQAAELRVLGSLLKQRREAAELYRKGHRPELADKEEAEIALIEGYMPRAATPADLDAAVAAAIAETGASSPKEMGLVMKAAQARLAGKRVDGKALSERVRARLGY